MYHDCFQPYEWFNINPHKHYYFVLHFPIMSMQPLVDMTIDRVGVERVTLLLRTGHPWAVAIVGDESLNQYIK